MNERLIELKKVDLRKSAKILGRTLASATLAFSMGAIPVKADGFAFMNKGESGIFNAGCVFEGSVKVNGQDTALDSTDPFSAILTILNINNVQIDANGKVAYACGDPNFPGETAAVLLDRAQREGCLGDIGCHAFYQQEVGASLYADQPAVEPAMQPLGEVPVQGKLPLQGKPPVQAPVPVQAVFPKPPVQAPVQAPLPPALPEIKFCTPTVPGMRGEAKRDVELPRGSKIIAPAGSLVLGDVEVAPVTASPIGETNPGVSAHDNLANTGAISVLEEDAQVWAKFGGMDIFCPKTSQEQAVALVDDINQTKVKGCSPIGCPGGVEVYDVKNGIPSKRGMY